MLVQNENSHIHAIVSETHFIWWTVLLGAISDSITRGHFVEQFESPTYLNDHSFLIR